MNINQKPLPLYRPRLRKRCPICSEVSYSAAGIHPQCAMRHADPNRGQTKARLKMTKPPPTIAGLKRWQKVCPGCKAANHVRQKACACGYSFTETNS